MTVEAFAPAKVNLTLHVTGRRADGYHLLDSLVVFVDVGDTLHAALAATGTPRLEVVGPRAAGVPTGPDNLVLRAAALFEPPVPATLTLDKHLPAAAGIGGGSSDAAACLRVLAALSGRDLPPAAAVLGLGADVPVCLSARPQRMRGIGEVLSPAPPLPPLWAVLVNPGQPTPTGAVFAGLARRDNPPMPEALPTWESAAALFAWLAGQRNDLEAPARALVPEIATVLAAIGATAGCGLARMSGSGATCFGLYGTGAAAEAAAEALRRPGWWVAAGAVLAGDVAPRAA